MSGSIPVLPQISWSKDYLTAIVAVFGTTISPYLFFLAGKEAEDVRTMPQRQILKRAPEQGEAALARIQLDTLVGMGISNSLGSRSMITTAATLNLATEVVTSRKLRKSERRLRPGFHTTAISTRVRTDRDYDFDATQLAWDAWLEATRRARTRTAKSRA